MFYQTPETFKEMWRQVSEETGTTWTVEAKMLDLGKWPPTAGIKVSLAP